MKFSVECYLRLTNKGLNDLKDKMKKLKRKVAADEKNIVTETRKSCRHIKLKKNKDFEYGSVKVTSYKIDKSKPLTESKVEKPGHDESFSERKNEDTDRKFIDNSQSENKIDDICTIKVIKKDKQVKESNLNTINSSKTYTKEFENKDVSTQVYSNKVIEPNKSRSGKEEPEQENAKIIETVFCVSEIKTRSSRKVNKNENDDFEYYKCVKLKDIVHRSKRLSASIDCDKAKYQNKNEENCDKTDIHGALDKKGKSSTIVSDIRAEVNDTKEHDNMSGDIERDENRMEDDADSDVSDVTAYTNASKLTCLYCSLLFSCKNEYVLHLKESHKTLHLCEHCTICFETKNELDKHLKESHGQSILRLVKSKSQIYKCNYDGCFKEFTKEINCQKHISRDHLIMKYTCKVCGNDFKQQGLLSRHIKLIHAKNTLAGPSKKRQESLEFYKCDYEGCSKQFSNKSNRKKHIDSVHLNIRKFHCEYCGHTFKTSSSLKVHITSFHTKDEDKKQYECDVCKKIFFRKAGLHLHQSLHTNIKSFVCSFEGCGKAFRLKTTLAKHEKTHTDEKPYQCPDCGERFSRKTYLESHMYKHTGMKNYKCDICNRTFSQKGNMITHKLLHNRDRTIFKCPKCSQTFNFKSNMKKHLQRHATEECCLERRSCDKFGENITEEDSNGQVDINSELGSNDVVKITTIANKLNVGNIGRRVAIKLHKVWLTPTVMGTMQKSTKPIVLVVKPVNSPEKSKIQGKIFEKVKIPSICVSKGSGENRGNDVGNILPLKFARHEPASKSIESQNKNKSASLCGKIDDNVQQGDDDLRFDIKGMSRPQSETEDTFTRSPIYVSIEQTRNPDSNSNVKQQVGTNNNNQSEEKTKTSNPTFTIELNSDGLPVARLQANEQSVSDDTQYITVSNVEGFTDQVVTTEEILSDIMKEQNNTFEECTDQVVFSQQILNDIIIDKSNNIDEELRDHVSEQIESNIPVT